MPTLDTVAAVRNDTRAVAAAVVPPAPVAPADEVTLVAWTPDAEVELVTGMLYAVTDKPETQLRRFVEDMDAGNAAGWWRPTSVTGATAATSPDAPWSGSGTASTSAPTMARSATCN